MNTRTSKLIFPAILFLFACLIAFGENGPTPQVIVGRSGISDGSVTNAKLAEPVSVANGGTGATTAAAGLAALGGASLNGSSTVDFAANHVKAADGTAAAPAYTFSSDSDTGIYHYGTNDLALTGGGVQRLRVNADGVGIGANPANYVTLKLDGGGLHTVRANNTPSIISANTTEHHTAMFLDTTIQRVAAGVTNSGSTRGLGIEAFMNSADFQGTLAANFGANISAGIYSGTGTISNCYALYLKNYNLSGTITNNWGLYQETAAARNYFAGRTLFGTTTDDGVSALQVAGGGLRLVGGAAPSSPAEGNMYFNSTDKHFYGWNGTAWVQLDN